MYIYNASLYLGPWQGTRAGLGGFLCFLKQTSTWCLLTSSTEVFVFVFFPSKKKTRECMHMHA